MSAPRGSAVIDDPTAIAMSMQRVTRNQALEDAARVAELVNMPPGRGPVLLFEVRAEIASAIRRLIR